MINYYKQIFTSFYEIVQDSGGDGGGTIYCYYLDYKDVAKEFELFLNNIKYEFEKKEYDESILFYQNQESFKIEKYDKEKPVGKNYDDIVIII